MRGGGLRRRIGIRQTTRAYLTHLLGWAVRDDAPRGRCAADAGVRRCDRWYLADASLRVIKCCDFGGQPPICRLAA